MDRRLGRGQGLSTRALSRALYAHPRGRLGLLLGPAVVWLLVFYLVALVLLLMTSLWQQDVFTAELVRKWTLDNYDKLFTGQDGLWLRVYGRTVLLATIVTLADIALAFPLAWFMARVAAPRWRTLLFLAVVVPLWSRSSCGSSPGGRSWAATACSTSSCRTSGSSTTRRAPSSTTRRRSR